jgi:hypothetical protein
MTRNDIIRMAREACETTNWKPGLGNEHVVEFMERFAALVAAAERDRLEPAFKQLEALMQVRETQPNKPCCLAEREACAQIADAEASIEGVAQRIAAAIRARGNT